MYAILRGRTLLWIRCKSDNDSCPACGYNKNNISQRYEYIPILDCMIIQL